MLRRMAILGGFVAVVAACGGTGGSTARSTDSSSTADLFAQVASFDLAVGPAERFLVGVFSADRGELGYGAVDLSFSYLGATAAAGVPVAGPRATGQFLSVPGAEPSAPRAGPAFLRRSEGRGVYEATVGFDKPGFWEVAIEARMTDGVTRATTADFQVLATHNVPSVGDTPPSGDTLTLTTPGAAQASIDSRATGGLPIPDPELHQRTVADAVAARRPVLVVFATPTFCVSRFCGPVTDMVAELAAAYGDRATFIHVEIWKDYEARQLNDAVVAWLTQGDTGGTEPWVFLIGADGRVAARWDNVASRSEIEPMLQALPVIGPA